MSLGGRVACPPELRVTPAGTPVVIFGLSLGPGERPGGGRGPGAAVRVMARGPLAREIGPRLVPGLAVYVEGRLESRMIESQGARRPQLEVDALVIECLEEAPGAGGETARPPGAAPAEGEG